MNNFYKSQGYDIDIDDSVEGSTIAMSVGPSHPSTHGTLRLILKTDGEYIVDVEPEIGFLHTGFEKIAEHRSYNQFITVTDRMNYISPLNNNIGFAIAVEDLLGITVPKRAQIIRVIMAELSRISDHIICVGLQGMDLGAFSVFLWAFVEREKLYDIFEAVTGARLTTSYTRVGGLAFDVPPDFSERVLKVIKSIELCIREIEAMLSRNRIFMDRSQGIGVLSKEDALSYGVTGPMLRASGVSYDIRKVRPYSSYEEFDFLVPVEDEGDSYARYIVRVEEMKESLKIIRQAIKALASFSGADVNYFDKKKVVPEKGAVYSNMESLIHHFKVVMPGEFHGINPPIAECYSSTESPNGELGFYIVSNGSSAPYRLRIRPPSLMNYQCFASIAKGHLLSDIPAILSTFNVIAGELDR